MENVETRNVVLNDGVRLTVCKDDGVSRNIRRHNTYHEIELLEKWYLPHAGQIKCVYDLGANIGNNAIYFAKYAKDANVFAFEPVPATFQILQANIEQNDLASRIKAFPYASGEEDASVKMEVNTKYLDGSVISDKGTQTVQVRALDGLDLPAPDFIKMDVEGCQLQTLKGMERTLPASSPYLWIEIFSTTHSHGRSEQETQETFQFLASMDYFPVDINLPTHDFFFVKSDAAASEKIRLLSAFVAILHQASDERMMSMRESFSKSRSYKLGHALLAPLRVVRRIVRRRT